jgi:hypothetical protein
MRCGGLRMEPAGRLLASWAWQRALSLSLQRTIAGAGLPGAWNMRTWGCLLREWPGLVTPAKQQLSDSTAATPCGGKLPVEPLM